MPRDLDDELEIIGWSEHDPDDPVLEFPDEPAARRWVRNSLSDPADIVTMRRLLAEQVDSPQLSRMTDDEVVGLVASRLVRGDLLVTRPGPAKSQAGGAVPAKPEPAPAAAAPAPEKSKKSEEKRKYYGTIKGPSGPLKNWPFLLKRAGRALDGGLDGGSSSNTYRDGAWLSGSNGEFKFENLPEDRYAIEVLMPRGSLVRSTKAKPAGVDETGHRSALPEPFDPHAFTEDPDEIVSSSEE